MPLTFPQTADGVRWWLGQSLYWVADFLPNSRGAVQLCTLETSTEEHLLVKEALEWRLRQKDPRKQRGSLSRLDLPIEKCYSSPEAAFRAAREILERDRDSHIRALEQLEHLILRTQNGTSGSP